MSFKREWDSSCPRIWDKWEQDGFTWTVEDLPPEDEEAASELLKLNQIPDEYLCKTYGIKEDPEAIAILSHAFRKYMSCRLSLACYKVEGHKKTLVGVNICIVKSNDIDMNEDKNELRNVKNEKLGNLLRAVFFVKGLRKDECASLGLDKILTALGLCVARDYRGIKLGAKLLNAREPLCKHVGIKATATMFTGPTSQKLAVRCGYKQLREIKVAQLADAGIYPFSKDDNTVLKVLYKRFE